MAKNKPTQTRSSANRSATTGMFLKKSDAVAHRKRGKIVEPATNQNRRRERIPAVAHPDEWSEFDKLDDKQIGNAVARDRDAAPLGDDDFWKKAGVVMPVSKQAISIRIDEDVVGFFKKNGSGYQSRMNAVLRSYMEAKK